VTTVPLENTRVLQESRNAKVVQRGGTKQKRNNHFVCHAFLAPETLKLAKQIVLTVQLVDLHPEPLPMTRCAPIVKEVNTKTKKVNRTAKVATLDDGAT
jgi:hypothetical protein